MLERLRPRTRSQQVDLDEPITMDDISILLPKNTGIAADISEYILQTKTFQMKHKLNRINTCISTIRERWPDATPVEIFVAFDMSNCCVDDLVENLESSEFKQTAISEAKCRLSTGSSTKRTPQSNEREESNSDDDDEFRPSREVFARERPVREKTVSLPKVELLTKTTVKGKERRRWSKNCPIDISKIPPNPPEVPKDEWIQWSEVRRKAFLNRHTDLNAYLYRFPPVGVQQRNGPWDEDEKRRFLKRMREIRGDSPTLKAKWGLFSQAIPGRVGYQCSNFYRLLIENGEVEDSAYTRDKTGRLRHTSFLNGRTGAVKEKKAAAKKSKSTHVAPDDVETFTLVSNGGADGIVCRSLMPEKSLSRYEQWALENPNPDWKDSLTGEFMRVPTLAPDGYVLDYNTWSKTMEGSETMNPFTRMKHHKRNLVVLTVSNYDEYKSQIKYVGLSGVMTSDEPL